MGLTQVSTDGVKNDAITKTKIPANQIEASELADNAVDTNAIANNAVTAGKLASGVQTTINNNADNRLITGSGTASTLEGEANATFNGSSLGLNSSSTTEINLQTSNNTRFKIHAGSNFAQFLTQNNVPLTFKTDTGTGSGTERIRINTYGSLVRSGHSYANYVTSMKTVSSSSARNVQVLEDCYGQWLVVGKISSTDEFKGDMQSVADLDTTNNQLTGDPKWSSLFGETYPSEVRYISARDWKNWRDTRVLDFIHGVPDDRKWKNFFTSGQSSGMPQVSGTKRGWTCAGAYDGFGRWRNPTFLNHKMTDSGQGDPTISETFFTTAGQTMNWYSGNTDAKIHARHNSDTGGQDDEITTGYGWDDTILIREDNFPNTAANGTGTDVGSYNLWICIKLGSPTFGHN